MTGKRVPTQRGDSNRNDGSPPGRQVDAVKGGGVQHARKEFTWLIVQSFRAAEGTKDECNDPARSLPRAHNLEKEVSGIRATSEVGGLGESVTSGASVTNVAVAFDESDRPKLSTILVSVLLRRAPPPQCQIKTTVARLVPSFICRM